MHVYQTYYAYMVVMVTNTKRKNLKNETLELIWIQKGSIWREWHFLNIF